MPWKECSVMDERLQFVARRLAEVRHQNCDFEIVFSFFF
jgi:hypothetical protein